MMLIDTVWLGPTPPEESAAQTTSNDFARENEIECRVFRRMLTRLFPVPENVYARITVKSSRHDFGTYREVVVLCSNGPSLDFACSVESNCPPNWDDLARAELAWYQESYRYQQKVRQGELTQAQVPALFRQLDPPAQLPPEAQIFSIRPATSYKVGRVVVSESWVTLPTPAGEARVVSELHPTGHLAIRLVGADKPEPFAVITCHIPDARYELAGDEVFVKMWSENAPVRDSLLATGMFFDTGLREPTGFVAAEVWRLTPLFIEQMAVPELRRAA